MQSRRRRLGSEVVNVTPQTPQTDHGRGQSFSDLNIDNELLRLVGMGAAEVHAKVSA